MGACATRIATCLAAALAAAMACPDARRSDEGFLNQRSQLPSAFILSLFGSAGPACALETTLHWNAWLLISYPGIAGLICSARILAQWHVFCKAKAAADYTSVSLIRQQAAIVDFLCAFGHNLQICVSGLGEAEGSSPSQY